ncbi:MAG TPA: alpha/beta fold hydrolase [Streptosporangiaceae bacterium]
MSEPSRPFHDLDAYVAIPRVGALRLSPDGGRLVASVSELAPGGTKYTSAIWEIDPDGTAPARRLTRSAPGESAPAFLPDGSLLFTSRRDDPARGPDDPAGEGAALWLLPASGGEPRRIASRPGGVDAVAVARTTGRVFFASGVFPGAADADDDAKRRKARSEAGVSALLHEGYPVRYWDHDLGVAETRLFAADLEDGPEAPLGVPRDLTPEPGRALAEQGFQAFPDGAAVVTGWRVRLPGGRSRGTIVLIDAATGERRTLAGDDDHHFDAPHVSPDGRYVACVRDVVARPDRPDELTLWLIDLATGESRDLLPDDEHWPAEIAWAPDSAHIYFTADASGRKPVFRVAVESAALTRVTGDDAAYDDPAPSPDGRFVYALRSTIGEPPTPVRVDPRTGEVTALPAPGARPAVPGTVTEIATTVADGATVRGWLVLPEGTSSARPAPLLLVIHGGPMSSWNHWHWRWNPWLMAARGYAVLLPDPALSTGYGQDFLARGWESWGGAPYDDLMAITDAAAARDDIDDSRVAALGGSFGGYMANWMAGHTDRFACIVSHASLWALDQMGATTDDASDWTESIGDPETTPERIAANTPHAHAAEIRTPMLVIHGDKDYRVPIGEALRLWWDLIKREVPDAKFLYFPDENHWVLAPGNVKVWYETVLAFLDHHVRAEPWRRPELL